jgi:lysophospholipase L1-like esterase
MAPGASASLIAAGGQKSVDLPAALVATYDNSTAGGEAVCTGRAILLVAVPDHVVGVTGLVHREGTGLYGHYDYPNSQIEFTNPITGYGPPYPVPKGEVGGFAGGSGGAAPCGNVLATLSDPRGHGYIPDGLVLVSGTVTDQSGNPVPGASVHISGPDNVTATTDSIGAFAELVHKGTYTVTVSPPADDLGAQVKAVSCQTGAITGDRCSGDTKNIGLTAGFHVQSPATFSWEMTPRFSSKNLDANGLVHYYTDPALVSPKYWTVKATVHEGRGTCDPHAAYSFLAISGPDIDPNGEVLASAPDGHCEYNVLFPEQATYQVEVLTASDGAAFAGSPVTVKPRDLLVVGIGDSVASGEGNPDIPATLSSVATWENGNCHRSANSFEPLSALDLARTAEKLKTASVTFVHVACSGASIDDGILTPSSGFLGLDKIPSQINQVVTLANGRPIDAVIVSAGANDLGFGTIVTFCVMHPNCAAEHASDMDPVLESELGTLPAAASAMTLGQAVTALLANLPNDYARLYAALSGTLHVEPSHVFITQYFDPTRDSSGAFCATVAGGISGPDVSWAYYHVVVPMNAAVATAAAKYGWTFVNGVQAAFRTHGYCSSDSWIVSLSQSASVELSPAGDMHPNHAGHQAIADLVEPPLTSTLFPGGKPVMLNPNPPS